MPGKFKDYIAIPKANHYRALHTTLAGPYGNPIEIQIRSQAMDSIAESGVASHWLYKDKAAHAEIKETTQRWLQSLIELQSASHDSTEFLEHVKVDLFPNEVYVFTPLGKILSLPRGATVVDFAYAVHTDIGNHCTICKINGESLPLRSELKNGDQVEIITSPNASPNFSWLSYVRTSRARSQIRHYFKTRNIAESEALGEYLLTQSLHQLGVDIRGLATESWEKMLQTIGLSSQREVLSEIGLGKRVADIVARRLANNQAKGNIPLNTSASASNVMLIDGSKGSSIELANCCYPIPGDSIIGLLRKGRGMLVHSNDCDTLSALRHGTRAVSRQWVEVDWSPTLDAGRLYESAIRVLVANRPGVLAKLASAIALENSNIINVNMNHEEGEAGLLYFVVHVQNRVHLARIMRRLRHIPDVTRISRINGTHSNNWQ